MKATSVTSFTVSIILVLSSCESPIESFHKMSAHSYSPTELWDAMLSSPKQSGHNLSQSGPSSFSYVHIKGVVGRVEAAPPNDAPQSVALIFDVDRSSVWNGITLHGSVRAPLGSKDQEAYRHFTAGQEVELMCQVGAAAMPFVYLVNCQSSR